MTLDLQFGIPAEFETRYGKRSTRHTQRRVGQFNRHFAEVGSREMTSDGLQNLPPTLFRGQDRIMMQAHNLGITGPIEEVAKVARLVTLFPGGKITVENCRDGKI